MADIDQIVQGMIDTSLAPVKTDVSQNATAIAALTSKVTALETRVTALEEGTTPPEPPVENPTLSVSDTNVGEKTGPAVFNVTLSKAATAVVTVDAKTVAGTATAGSDFTAVNVKLTFAVGETAKTVSVAIIDDTEVEVVERFELQLSGVTGPATILKGTGTCNITSDDTTVPPSDMPTTAAYKALTSNAARESYKTTVKAWYAANSGPRAGVALTPYTGSMSISGANVTIKGKTLKGSMRVTGANFLMEDCVFEGTSDWGIDAEGASNPIIRYTKFTGPKGMGNSAILGAGTFDCNDISGWQNGITFQGGPRGHRNYVHDLGPPTGGAGEAHVDGFSIQGGISNLMITENYIESWDTSCIILNNDFGKNDNIQTQRNWLFNRPGYKTAYAMYFYAKGGTTNSGIVDNVVERGNNSSPWSLDAVPTPMTGNVLHPTGAASNG